MNPNDVLLNRLLAHTAGEGFEATADVLMEWVCELTPAAVRKLAERLEARAAELRPVPKGEIGRTFEITQVGL